MTRHDRNKSLRGARPSSVHVSSIRPNNKADYPLEILPSELFFICRIKELTPLKLLNAQNPNEIRNRLRNRGPWSVSSTLKVLTSSFFAKRKKCEIFSEPLRVWMWNKSGSHRKSEKDFLKKSMQFRTPFKNLRI